MKSYVRLFKENKVKELENISRELISDSFPEPMFPALYRQDIYDEDYILCPLYLYKGYNDFQIGVTGTVKMNENYKQALIREIGEEVGLKVNYPEDLYFITNIKLHRGKRMSSYIVDIRDLSPVTKKEHNKPFGSQARDDRSRRVGCLVYGPKSYILDYLNQERIYSYKDVDCIVGIVAISGKLAREYFTIDDYDEVLKCKEKQKDYKYSIKRCK